MEIISGSTQGWALLDPEGLIRWDTFTTRVPPPGLGYIQVYKIDCTCDIDTQCGVWMYNYTPESTFWNQSFTYTADGNITINFEYGTIPTKFVVKQNGTEIFDTGYGGLTSYQAVLDQFLVSQGLPPENIDPSPPSSTSVTVVSGDIITVEVTCIAPEKASYRYMVGCIGGAINCVVSPWGAWGRYFVSGDFMNVCRTRERTITTPPSGGGDPCPPLSETDCSLLYEDKEIDIIIRTDAIFTRNLSGIILFEGDPGEKTLINQPLTAGSDITETVSASPYMAAIKLNDDSAVLSNVEIRDGDSELLYSGTYTGNLDIQFNILKDNGSGPFFTNPIIININ